MTTVSPNDLMTVKLKDSSLPAAGCNLSVTLCAMLFALSALCDLCESSKQLRMTNIRHG